MSSGRQIYTAEGLDWYGRFPASPAVRKGDVLAISGQVALDADMNVVAPGDVNAQTHHVFESIGNLLSAAGGSFDDVVDVVAFTKDPRDLGTVLEVARGYFAGDYPAWSLAGFLGSYVPGILVSIRVLANLGPGAKECYTPESLAWWGDRPASGGCKKGDILFVSAQSATDSEGNVLHHGDHCKQARVAYDRMLDVVGLAGASVADIIDFTSFHQDIRGAEATLLEVFKPGLMDGVPPEHVASTSHLGSPGLIKPGMLGAYRAVADLSPGQRVASTPESIWWKEVLPVAGGAKKEQGNVITIAGQVASASDKSIVAPGDISGQARYVFTCMQEVLEGFGASMDDVVEVVSFHKDPRAWEAAMEVGRDFFDSDGGPAWTPASMPGLWLEGYLHEIAALAVV
jgi:enamine deaminase RidA (YjgF/YER057c/UK114 family)